MAAKDSTDVLVIGSGAGGGTLATALAGAGARVLVLEKGPYHGLLDFTHDELAICRRNFFVPFSAHEPHVIRRGPAQPFRRSTDAWTACCVGGGTVHMAGFFYRLHRDDLRQQTRLGAPPGTTVADWPISYEELEPWYERAELELGVSGQAGDNPSDEARARPYPLPPLRAHALGALLADAARAQGRHPFVTPRAVLSDAYDGRPPCNYCGFCALYGCENGAKSSVLAALLPRALRTGRCRLRTRAMAREITLDARGRARGVLYADERGVVREVRARVVVVSCSAVESARLLLASRSAGFPHGLANSSGLVGKHLTFLAHATVQADIRRDGTSAAARVLGDPLPWLGVSVQDFYRLPAGSGAAKGGTLRFDFLHPNPIFNAEMVAMAEAPPLFGQPLKDRLRRHFHEERHLEAEIFAEFLPTPGSFVELDPHVRDQRGLPVARIAVEHHPANAVATRYLGARAVEIFGGLGVEARVLVPLDTMMVVQHGTCRFGTNPSRSVLDPSCRAHDVPNLYVVDGSFMPTSGGVPSTLTIQANAFRVADIIASRLKRREH